MTLPRLILLVFLLGLLASCTREPDGRVHIQYSFWGSIEQERLERQIVAAFEKENPDIKVAVLPIGGNRYAEKFRPCWSGNPHLTSS
ncbi:MAG: extracellular solute-binding protein [Blastochloris sp.]|nr:extracellular solute-binding protein [Blastochloris sp.]